MYVLKAILTSSRPQGLCLLVFQYGREKTLGTKLRDKGTTLRRVRDPLTGN